MSEMKLICGIQQSPEPKPFCCPTAPVGTRPPTSICSSASPRSSYLRVLR